eukprot:6213745-Pleurochrysis_carterae.AAC.1
MAPYALSYDSCKHGDKQANGMARANPSIVVHSEAQAEETFGCETRALCRVACAHPYFRTAPCTQTHSPIRAAEQNVCVDAGTGASNKEQQCEFNKEHT